MRRIEAESKEARTGGEKMTNAERRQIESNYNGICHICFGENWQDCKCLEGDNPNQNEMS